MQDRSVSIGDLTRVVQDNNMSVKGSSCLGTVVHSFRADIAAADIPAGDIHGIESNVVTGNTRSAVFEMHLDRHALCGDTSGGEGDDHTGSYYTGLDTVDGSCSDTRDLVHILEGKTEGLMGRAQWGLNGIDGLHKGLTFEVTTVSLLGPPFKPRHVGGLLQQVVSVPSGNGDEGDGSRVVTDSLD